jgi:uncharacterized protein YjbI with pentapeptide repeats
MTKIPAFTALALFGCSPLLLAQDGGGSATVSVYTQQAEDLMRGMTFIDGQFVATHTLDDSSSATASSTVLGYPDASHLPDSAPLLSAFNALEFDANNVYAWMEGQGLTEGYEGAIVAEGYTDPALDYFMGLAPLEQASLYRALVEEDPLEAVVLLRLLSGTKFLNPDWLSGAIDYPHDPVSDLLKALPSGEAGAALNAVTLPWGVYAQMDLSGLNLTGWDTAGKNLGSHNLTGSNVTVEQLNAASTILGTNLSGLNLSGLVLTGKSVQNINFSDTNVTAEQINGAAWIIGANLSGTGITRADLEASGKWAEWMLDMVTF